MLGGPLWVRPPGEHRKHHPGSHRLVWKLSLAEQTVTDLSEASVNSQDVNDECHRHVGAQPPHLRMARPGALPGTGVQGQPGA